MNKLAGANMDIDLATPANQISWSQEKCPWNAREGNDLHHCAVKNVFLCQYFCGVEYPDSLLCCFPDKNPHRTTS